MLITLIPRTLFQCLPKIKKKSKKIWFYDINIFSIVTHKPPASCMLWSLWYFIPLLISLNQLCYFFSELLFSTVAMGYPQCCYLRYQFFHVFDVSKCSAFFKMNISFVLINTPAYPASSRLCMFWHAWRRRRECYIRNPSDPKQFF